MPQLNTAPWFTTMCFAWLIIMSTLLLQITAITSPCDISSGESTSHHTLAWNWPW